MRRGGVGGGEGGVAWSLKGLPGDVGMRAEVPAKREGGGMAAAGVGMAVATGVVEGMMVGRRRRRRSDDRRWPRRMGWRGRSGGGRPKAAAAAAKGWPGSGSLGSEPSAMLKSAS